MVDFITFSISIIGVLAGFFFWFIEQSEGKELNSDYISKVKETAKERLDVVLKDYEITNKEVERRENITLLIGSILITGSILVLGNTAAENSNPIFHTLFLW